ncbi:hypothetical protein QOT17_003455 [Balamuthia mandrillaris]
MTNNGHALWDSELTALLQDEEFSDVVFHVGKDGCRIAAHKCIVAAVSPTFRAWFRQAAAVPSPQPGLAVGGEHQQSSRQGGCNIPPDLRGTNSKGSNSSRQLRPRRNEHLPGTSGHHGKGHTPPSPPSPLLLSSLGKDEKGRDVILVDHHLCKDSADFAAFLRSCYCLLSRQDRPRQPPPTPSHAPAPPPHKQQTASLLPPSNNLPPPVSWGDRMATGDTAVQHGLAIHFGVQALSPVVAGSGTSTSSDHKCGGALERFKPEAVAKEKEYLVPTTAKEKRINSKRLTSASGPALSTPTSAPTSSVNKDSSQQVQAKQQRAATEEADKTLTTPQSGESKRGRPLKRPARWNEFEVYIEKQAPSPSTFLGQRDQSRKKPKTKNAHKDKKPQPEERRAPQTGTAKQEKLVKTEKKASIKDKNGKLGSTFPHSRPVRLPDSAQLPPNSTFLELQGRSDTCHPCKTKREEWVGCPLVPSHRFCSSCIERHFGIDYRNCSGHQPLPQWRNGCPACTFLCPCAMCRRKARPGESQHQDERLVIPCNASPSPTAVTVTDGVRRQTALSSSASDNHVTAGRSDNHTRKRKALDTSKRPKSKNNKKVKEEVGVLEKKIAKKIPSSKKKKDNEKRDAARTVPTKEVTEELHSTASTTFASNHDAAKKAQATRPTLLLAPPVFPQGNGDIAEGSYAKKGSQSKMKELQARFGSTGSSSDNRKASGDGTGKKENDDRRQKSSHRNGQQLFRSIHTRSKGAVHLDPDRPADKCSNMGNQLKVKQGHYVFTGTEQPEPEAFLGLVSAGSALMRRPAAGRTATLPHPLSGENG